MPTDSPNPAPMPSASVILLREDDRVESPFCIYLLKRAGSSRFMPGRYVFPGGRIEPHDGPDPGDMETLKRCAARELWEEAGVVLARGDLPDTAELEARRQALQKGEASLEEALSGLGLDLDYQSLVPFARWITPDARPQRFDATFFLAQMPRGQRARSDRMETSQGLWLSPGQALEQNQRDEVGLGPPQVIMMAQLARGRSAAGLLEADHDLKPVKPMLWINGKVRMIMLPWDPEYADGRPSDTEGLGRPCQADEASRLVNRGAAWLPYKA